MKLQKILVPTDFSEISKTALDYALSFCQKFPNTSIKLLHVWEPPYYLGSEVLVINPPMGGVHQNVVDFIQERCKEQMKEVLKNLPPELEVTSEIVTGDIADKVQEIATQEKFDFIIVGTHGRKGLAHLFLGSVAEKIIRSAPCPVLTVRTPEKK